MFRIISNLSGVDAFKFRSQRFLQGDMEKINGAIDTMKKLNISIDDTAGLNIDKLRERATAKKMNSGTDLIVVDYLQLIDSKEQSQTQKITEISRKLKIIAKELDVPVIAISQLSRAVELRNDKRPILSDLRDSGSIEQDADIVMFMYKDDYYTKHKADVSNMEIIISKHRFGEGNRIVNIDMHNKTMKFSNKEEVQDIMGGEWVVPV